MEHELLQVGYKAAEGSQFEQDIQGDYNLAGEDSLVGDSRLEMDSLAVTDILAEMGSLVAGTLVEAGMQLVEVDIPAEGIVAMEADALLAEL